MSQKETPTEVFKRALAHAPFARVLLKPIDPWRLCEEIRAVVRPR